MNTAAAANPMTTPPAIERFPVWHGVGVVLAAAGGGLVVGLASALALAGGQSLRVALATWAVCTIAALLGLGPIYQASRHGLDKVALATLGAMMLRLVIAGAGVVVIAAVLGLPIRDTALWTLAWYLLMLVAEVVVIYRYVASNGPAHAAAVAAERSQA